MSGADDDGPPADPVGTNRPTEPETGRSANEPSEFDPESLGPDPPSPPDPDEIENPRAVKLFWRLLFVFNVAILGLALGPMLVFFENRWTLGLQVLFAGAVVFAYGTFRYYRFRARQDADDGDADGTGEREEENG